MQEAVAAAISARGAALRPELSGRMNLSCRSGSGWSIAAIADGFDHGSFTDTIAC